MDAYKEIYVHVNGTVTAFDTQSKKIEEIKNLFDLQKYRNLVIPYVTKIYFMSTVQGKQNHMEVNPIEFVDLMNVYIRNK